MWSKIVGLFVAIVLLVQPLSPVAAEALNSSRALPGSRPLQPVQLTRTLSDQLLITNYLLPTLSHASRHTPPHALTQRPTLPHPPTPSLPAICSSTLQLQHP